MKFFDYFSYRWSIHRLWVLVRTVSARRVGMTVWGEEREIVDTLSGEWVRRRDDWEGKEVVGRNRESRKQRRELTKGDGVLSIY